MAAKELFYNKIRQQANRLPGNDRYFYSRVACVLEYNGPACQSPFSCSSSTACVLVFPVYQMIPATRMNGMMIRIRLVHKVSQYVVTL